MESECESESVRDRGGRANLRLVLWDGESSTDGGTRVEKKTGSEKRVAAPGADGRRERARGAAVVIRLGLSKSARRWRSAREREWHT